MSNCGRKELRKKYKRPLMSQHGVGSAVNHYRRNLKARRDDESNTALTVNLHGQSCGVGSGGGK